MIQNLPNFWLQKSMYLETWSKNMELRQLIQANNLAKFMMVAIQGKRRIFWLIFQSNSIMDLEDLPEENLSKPSLII